MDRQSVGSSPESGRGPFGSKPKVALGQPAYGVRCGPRLRARRNRAGSLPEDVEDGDVTLMAPVKSGKHVSSLRLRLE